MTENLVFIPNRGAYNFAAAEKFGKLVYLTEGFVNRFDVATIHRLVEDGMADAREDDYIVITSLPMISGIAQAIFARRFGRLNLLIFHREKQIYVERSVVLA